MKTNNFTLVNLDTDSVSFCKKNMVPFTEEEQFSLLEDLNSNFPEKIRWEHDGVFSKVIILKAKNYILLKDNKLTKKGSSLKSSKIEPRLKDFMDEVIQCLLTDAKDSIVDVYNKYIREIHNLKSIDGWTSKRTITDKVLNAARSNEQKLLDALNGATYQMGDKVYVYYGEVKKQEEIIRYKSVKKVKTPYIFIKETIENPLFLKETWDAREPNHSIERLMEKLYNTLVIFKNVIDIEKIPRYHLKNKKAKEELDKLIK